MKIPTTTDEIDTAWMAACLSERLPSKHLRSIELSKAHSGTTGRARFALEWDSSMEHALPATVFVKLPPVDDAQKETVVEWGMGLREAKFYRYLSRNLRPWTLRCFHSDWSDDGRRYIMVMEDLRESGGRPASARRDSTLERASQIVTALGTMHGKYWNSPRFSTDLNWLKPFLPLRTQGTWDLLHAAVTHHAEDMPSSFRTAGDLIASQTDGIADVLCAGTPTLVHGDCHVGNLFVTSANQTGFLDWALCARMHGMWDISYFLCNSLPSDIRRASENELIRKYGEALVSSGGPKRSFDELFDDYRFFALYAWISPTVTIGAGSRMQPSEFAVEGVRRSSKALDDLSTLDEVKRRLAV